MTAMVCLSPRLVDEGFKDTFQALCGPEQRQVMLVSGSEEGVADS